MWRSANLACWWGCEVVQLLWQTAEQLLKQFSGTTGGVGAARPLLGIYLLKKIANIYSYQNVCTNVYQHYSWWPGWTLKTGCKVEEATTQSHAAWVRACEAPRSGIPGASRAHQWLLRDSGRGRGWGRRVGAKGRRFLRMSCSRMDGGDSRTCLQVARSWFKWVKCMVCQFNFSKAV